MTTPAQPAAIPQMRWVNTGKAIFWVILMPILALLTKSSAFEENRATIAWVSLALVFNGFVKDFEPMVPALECGLLKQATEKAGSQIRHGTRACLLIVCFVPLASVLLFMWANSTCPCAKTPLDVIVCDPNCNTQVNLGGWFIMCVAIGTIMYGTYLDMSRAIAIGRRELERQMEEAAKKK